MAWMEAVPTPQLERFKSAILSDLSDRGDEANKSRCVIEMLLSRYQSGLRAPIPSEELWNECWAKNEAVLPAESSAREAELIKVRMAVSRLRKKITSYRMSPHGREEKIVPLIPKNGYRLIFEPNRPMAPDLSDDLKIAKASTIGLLCALRSNWFNSELIAGAERSGRAYPVRLVVAYSDGDLEEEATQLQALSDQCSAVIAVPVLDEFSRGARDLHLPFLELIEKDYPLVFVDRRVPDCNAPLVGCDNELGGELAARYLVEHQRCAKVLVVGESGSSAARARVDSFKACLRASTTNPRCGDTVWLDIPEERGGFEYMRRLLASSSGEMLLKELSVGAPIGLFATNDAIIRGIRAYLDSPASPTRASGLHMVGFDGRDFGNFMNPPLVSIKQDFYEIGTQAVRVAMDAVAARQSRGPSASMLSVPPVTRTSVRLLLRDTPWPDGDD